jgi:hypothetical protein
VLPKILWRTLKEIQQIQFDKHAAKELQEAIQTFNPDVVYERSAWMSNGSADVLKPFNIKHVVEINAPFEEEVKEFEQTSKQYNAKLEIIEGGSHDLMLDNDFEKTASLSFEIGAFLDDSISTLFVDSMSFLTKFKGCGGPRESRRCRFRRSFLLLLLLSCNFDLDSASLTLGFRPLFRLPPLRINFGLVVPASLAFC